MPAQTVTRSFRDAGEFAQAAAAYRQHIGVHEAGVEQLANDIAGAASRLELVDIGAAIGVDPAQQRHHLGQGGKVVPVDHDAGRARHRHPVDQVVGGATGGQQRHHGIDDAAFVHQHPYRWNRVGGTGALPPKDRAHRLAGQFLTQVLAGVDKGGAGHVQAHGFEQHLVAVGGAVKGAGAGAVVGGRFGLQQLGTAHQALRRLLTHLGLGVVRQARGHRAGRHKHRGQVAKMQGADQQPGHDLVAHAQHQRAMKHIMAQRHRSGHGDHIAAEKAQFHAGRALGHAVAHGRHAAGHLRSSTQAARLDLDQIRVVLQRRMG